MAKPPNILVVEDENIIAMDIQNKLKRLGYAVSGLVSSGEDAIQSAGQFETDLVLMDIMLKGDMDGIEAAQQIRSKYDIPVVYLTAYKDENTLKRAKITDPFGYLLKPFMVGELHTTIEMALNKHEMEANLKKSEQWLAMTLNSMGDAVIATDASANLTFMNPIAQDMTGWSQHDIMGKPLMEVLNIYDEDNGQPSECPIDDILRDEALKVDSFHYILVSDSGKESVVTCTLAPMKNENDEVTGAVLVLRDITRQRKMERELKQAHDELEDRVEARTLELAKSNEELQAEIQERQRVEKGLRESEERYRNLIQHTYDLITEMDGLGNILYTSPNLFEILGYENSELEGKNIFELVEPDDCVHIKSVFQKTAQDLSSYQAVSRYKHKNGEWKTLECTGKAYTAANGQVRTIIAARDISKKIRMEEELLRAQKVESLGVLAGGIAHDFNNLLTTVLGHISLTMMDLNPDDISTVSLKEAEKACLRAKDLTSQLVAFAQGGTDLEKVESSLEGIIKDSTKLAVSGSNVDVEYNFENGVWNVEINEDQINQVVFNLVLNSVQAMPTGGVISIGVENEDLEENDLVSLPEGKYVRVSFQDDGAGIPKEIVPKIFDPFFSTKQNGCGLGLALVYSIIKSHGGYLEVDSETGSGTTINIHLPATQA